MDGIESPEQLIEALRSGSFGIQKGDTLSGLAQASGQRWTPELGQKIMAMNPGRFGSEQDMDLIQAGERLDLPFEPRRPKPPALARRVPPGPSSWSPQPGS